MIDFFQGVQTIERHMQTFFVYFFCFDLFSFKLATNEKVLEVHLSPKVSLVSIYIAVTLICFEFKVDRTQLTT